MIIKLSWVAHLSFIITIILSMAMARVIVMLTLYQFILGFILLGTSEFLLNRFSAGPSIISPS